MEKLILKNFGKLRQSFSLRKIRLVLTVLAVTALTGPAPRIQAEDWPLPEGSQMSEFRDSLDEVIDHAIGQDGQDGKDDEYAQKEDIDSKVENWAAGENLNKYDMGVTLDEVKQNYQMAQLEMLMYMGTIEMPMECGYPQKYEEGCECGLLAAFLPDYFRHYYMYFLPVAIVEGAEVPYQSAFIDENEAKIYKKIAYKVSHLRSLQYEPEVEKKAGEQSQKNQWSHNKVMEGTTNTEIVQKSEEDAGETMMLRAYRHKAGSFMVNHHFDTGEEEKGIDTFHELFRQPFKEWWVHDGAVLPQNPFASKREVPVRISEWPQYIHYLYNSIVSYDDNDLKDYMFKKDDKETCRKGYRYEADGGFTPNDILDQKIRQDLDDQNTDEKRCLPGNLGRVGPWTAFVVGTLFGPGAARVAIHRALLWGEEKQSDKYHPYRYGFNGETKGKYAHMLPGMPRSRVQELTQKPNFNPDMTEGCAEYYNEKYFIPKKVGRADNDANMNYTDTHNRTYQFVQWNPIRGCHFPCFPKPHMPIPQMILK